MTAVEESLLVSLMMMKICKIFHFFHHICKYVSTFIMKKNILLTLKENAEIHTSMNGLGENEERKAGGGILI